MKACSLLLLMLITVISVECISQTNFTGATSNTYYDPSNWDNGLPVAGNDGTIPVGLTAEVIFVTETFDYNLTVLGTFLNTFGTITLSSTNVIDNQGTISNLGVINNLGTIYNCFGTYGGTLPEGNPLEETTCPEEEVCDGVDNDLNGEVDEGCGCMSLNACNYDPEAIEDDGMCVFPGCTYPSACNYDPTAGCENLSCTFPGCTDSNALNYQPSAGCDDSTCISDVSACDGDFNGDLQIDTTDLLGFLSVFGSACDP